MPGALPNGTAGATAWRFPDSGTNKTNKWSPLNTNVVLFSLGALTLTDKIMFGFRKRNRVDLTVALIAASGRATAEWFQHEECLQFPHADRWATFCGTIPAFAFVIVHETVVRNGPGLATPEQRAFFQSIEDALYIFYKSTRPECTVPICQSLLLPAELSAVCKAFGTDVDTKAEASPDMILGIILPKRLETYQKDWSAALFRLAGGLRDINFSDYAAIRLAADLTDIVTPTSLVGHTAADFQVEKYGSASIVLGEFSNSYLTAFP